MYLKATLQGALRKTYFKLCMGVVVISTASGSVLSRTALEPNFIGAPCPGALESSAVSTPQACVQVVLRNGPALVMHVFSSSVRYKASAPPPSVLEWCKVKMGVNQPFTNV